MTMNCDEWFEKLYSYLDRDLDATVTKEIDFHLKYCRPCFDRAEFERRIKERLKSSCGTTPCTEALRNRIKAILDKF